jgi:hypothetical protein
VKPTIRKQDGHWLLTRPGYGFAATATVTEHATWLQARQALLGTAVGSAGAQVERAAAPAALRYGPPHGHIRLGDHWGEQG